MIWTFLIYLCVDTQIAVDHIVNMFLSDYLKKKNLGIYNAWFDRNTISSKTKIEEDCSWIYHITKFVQYTWHVLPK